MEQHPASFQDLKFSNSCTCNAPVIMSHLAPGIKSQLIPFLLHLLWAACYQVAKVKSWKFQTSVSGREVSNFTASTFQHGNWARGGWTISYGQIVNRRKGQEKFGEPWVCMPWNSNGWYSFVVPMVSMTKADLSISVCTSKFKFMSSFMVMTRIPKMWLHHLSLVSQTARCMLFSKASP